MKRKLRRSAALMLALVFLCQFLSISGFAEETVTGSGTVDDPTTTVTVTETKGPGKSTTTTDTRWEGCDHPDSDTVNKVDGEKTETASREETSTQIIQSNVGSEHSKSTTITTEIQPGSEEDCHLETGPSTITEETSPYSDPVLESESSDQKDRVPVYKKEYEDISLDLEPGESKKKTLQPVNTENALSDIHSDLGEGAEEIRDTENTLIGYQKDTFTEDTVPNSHFETSSAVPNSQQVVPREGDSTAMSSESFALPPRPVPPADSMDGQGNQITYHVTDLYDKGILIGYCIEKSVKSPKGTILKTESETIYGTKTTEKAQNTPVAIVHKESVTEITESTVTKKTTQKKATVSGTPRELEASMGAVESENGHGKTDMTTLQPDLKALPTGHKIVKEGPMTGIYEKRYPSPEYGTNTPPDWNYTLVADPCYASSYKVNVLDPENDESAYNAWQFVLEDKNKEGNRHYVYCADLDTSPIYGARYDMINVEDAGYYHSADAAAQIERIAYHGDWGTKDGMGSLESVTDLLRQDPASGFQTDEINLLTGGEALTATQAAIWKYGNSGNLTLNENKISTVQKNDNFTDVNNPNSAGVQRIQKLYNYFTKMTGDVSQKSTVLLKKESVTGAAINIGRKQDDGKYIADVSFTLKDLPAESDDLVVVVKDDSGKEIARGRLAGTRQDGESQLAADNGTYQIGGLTLENNNAMHLELLGNQTLQKGVYLYSAPTNNPAGRSAGFSQTMIGVGSGYRDVKLSVDLTYRITDPTVTVKTEERSYTQQKQSTVTDRHEDTKTVNAFQVVTTKSEETGKQWSSQEITEKGGVTTFPTDPVETTSTFPTVPADTTEPTDTTRPSAATESGENRPGPRTGDNSGIWFLVMMITLAALMVTVPCALWYFSDFRYRQR